MAGLAADYEKVKKEGAEVIAISVDGPEKNRELVQKLNLTFPLLSDADHKVIDAYDLYNSEGKIAKPAMFVIDRKGVVRWVFLDEDYRIRAVNDTVLAELRKLG